MAPTRMKLRVRRRGGAAAGDAGGGERPEEEEESGRSAGTRSSRRKNNNTSSAATTTTVSPPPSSSSSSAATASARAVIAAEEASPDSKCPICLDRFNNLAYLDRCLHRFCFPCIQEWSHNKAECPLCKQPFASILHSVRAEDDFKEYTLRQPPASGSVAATVALVAAMASAARNNHQMRLMLRRHRGVESGEAATRRRRRERGGRARGAGVGEAVWAWYLDSPPLTLPPTLGHHADPSPGTAEDGRESGDQPAAEDSEPLDRGVIFEGLTGLSGGVTALAADDRESRRLLSRLATRRRLQREGGPMRRARERETVAFRRGLYRCGIHVSGVAGAGTQEAQQQRNISAEGFRQHPTLLGRLRPWLRRELTVLYGAHVSLVDIVQRIIMARLSRHGLEDTPTIEEELRPFLLARTDHFLHELVSFARSPLCLESYDLQAVYEPPAAALEQLATAGSSSESSSVIAISEGEEEGEGVGEGRRPAENGAESPLQRETEAGSSLSLAAWDDETPGPSYSTAEPSGPLSFSPGPPEAARQEGGERGEEEEECLIVGYKKPIAERTPELVQLSSDSEEQEEPKQEPMSTEKLLPSLTSPLSYLPTLPPSTSGSSRHEQEEKPKENEAAVAGGHLSRQRSWSSSSERSRKSVSTLSPAAVAAAVAAGHGKRQQEQDKSLSGDGETEKKRRKRSRRERERSRSGTLHDPKRRSPSPLHSSLSSSPATADFSWDYHSSQVSPLTSPSPSSSHSPSSSSWSSLPPRSSPPPSSLGRDSPSASPGTREKPSGKRKYKSRHLDNNSQDPTWRPSGSQSREKRRERKEKERRRRKRREKTRRSRKSSGGDRKRSRLDRSPSVEIIYEGTATAAQPHAHKRRRKRQRGTQISPPVVITLDSDSSHGDVINVNNVNDSSSPLSSQHTVDFSHLPPLPLLPSAGVGAALHPDVGELPADILDRGSDSWEAEPRAGAAAASPITVDNSDVDVDIETVEQRRSLLPPAPVDQQGPPKRGEGEQSGSGKVEYDRCLLATLLNSLQGSCSTPNGPSNNIGGQLELKGCPALVNREHRYPSIPPPPLLGRLADGKDLPSLLSPTRMHSRNTPPPLKHKDAVSSLPPPPSMSAGWVGEMLTNCSPAPSVQPTPSGDLAAAPPQWNSCSSFAWTSRLPPCSLPDLTSCYPTRFDGPDPASHSVSSSASPVGRSADASGGTPASVCNDSLPFLPPTNCLSEEEAAASIGLLATAADSRRPHVLGDRVPHELLPDLHVGAPPIGHRQNHSVVPIIPKVTADQPCSSIGSRTAGPSAHTDFHTTPEEFPHPTEFSPKTPKRLPTGCQVDSATDSFLPTTNRMASSTAPAVEGWSSEQPGSVNSSSC